MGPKSNNFCELSSENDMEEKLLHNTFLNGLNINKDKSLDMERKTPKNISSIQKRIQWADNNNFNRKDLLCNTNISKDLLFQKEIKPVQTHKKNKNIKSILKTRSASADIIRFAGPSFNLNSNNISVNLGNNRNLNNVSNSSVINNNPNPGILENKKNDIGHDSSNNSYVGNYFDKQNLNLNLNNNNFNNSDQKKNNNLSNNQNISSVNNKENINDHKINSNKNEFGQNHNNTNTNNPAAATRQNYFSNNAANPQENSINVNNNNLSKQRSHSFDQKIDKNNPSEQPKIIFTPNIYSIFNHNVNNYYIQSSNETNNNPAKPRENILNNNFSPQSVISNINNYDSNNPRNERPNSVNKKDSVNNNISPLNVNSNSMNFSSNNLLRTNTNNIPGNNKLGKSLENQRLLQNNFLDGNNNNKDNQNLNLNSNE